jgi:hypothetical protein
MCRPFSTMSKFACGVLGRAAYRRLVEFEGVNSPHVYTMSSGCFSCGGRCCAERVCGVVNQVVALLLAEKVRGGDARTAGLASGSGDPEKHLPSLHFQRLLSTSPCRIVSESMSPSKLFEFSLTVPSGSWKAMDRPCHHRHVVARHERYGTFPLDLYLRADRAACGLSASSRSLSTTIERSSPFLVDHVYC